MSALYYFCKVHWTPKDTGFQTHKLTISEQKSIKNNSWYTTKRKKILVCEFNIVPIVNISPLKVKALKVGANFKMEFGLHPKSIPDSPKAGELKRAYLVILP